ncbi:hypothetical protein [Heyndrickxia oleronia]|uniref:hypothetical protein n=1 Tax=Heyndrickxia oleronia TaxID=38875 RepID=UPI001C0E9FA0|nr:hypothetical protein [Heyndrickxia oleronia]MBU5214988.1 hypothetical protein [Heyndrickxia oleronia]
MKLADHLNHEQRKYMEKLRERNKPPSKKKRKGKVKEEKVNWHDIMGTNRDTFKRVGGRLRRK